MKNYNIKTSFVSPEGPKARANKTGMSCTNSMYIVHTIEYPN